MLFRSASIASVSAAKGKAMLAGSKITLDASIELWSATKVVTASNVTAKSADVTVAATNGTFVPVGTVLSITGTGFDGFVASNVAATMHRATSDTTLEVTGADTWNVYGATKLNMDDTKVEAGYGASVALADGDYVKSDENVTFSAKSAEEVVVADKDGKGYGTEVSTPAPITKGESYVAYTGVTVKINSGILQVPNPEFPSTNITIVTGSASGETIGVAKGTTVQAVGTAVASENIKVSEGTTDKTSSYVTSSNAGTATTAPDAVFKIGEKALTIEQAS